MTKVEETAHNAKEEAKKIVEAAVSEGPETRKEARRRQPWMPITGSILAGILLLATLGFFLGWL